MDWHDVLTYLYTCDRARYLKTMATLWGVEISKIAEIGVFRGRLSKRLREEFPNSSLYLIDPWQLPDLSEEAAPIAFQSEEYEEAYKNVCKQFSEDSNVVILRKPSVEAASIVSDPLDLVFVDGDHSYEAVKADLEAWTPKVRKGGILAGHDYHPDAFPGVVKAVDAYFEKKEVVVGQDCIWMVRI